MTVGGMRVFETDGPFMKFIATENTTRYELERCVASRKTRVKGAPISVSPVVVMFEHPFLNFMFAGGEEYGFDGFIDDAGERAMDFDNITVIFDVDYFHLVNSGLFKFVQRRNGQRFD